MLIPIAIYIRRSLPETMDKPSEDSGAQIAGSVFTKHTRLLILGILVMMSTTVSTQVGNYMTTYAINTLNLSATIAQIATTAGGSMTFIFALVAGYLADSIAEKAR